MRTQYIQSMMQTELQVRPPGGERTRPGSSPWCCRKKSPRLSHVQSTCMVRPTHKATDPADGWGPEFGGFLGLCEVFFLIQCRGGGFSPHMSSFFYTVNDQNITSHYVRSSEHKFFLVALLADISMFIYLQSLLQLLRQVIQLTQIDELFFFWVL